MRHPLSKTIMFAAIALLWLPAAAFCWNAVSPWQWRSKPLVGVEVKTTLADGGVKAFVDGSLQGSLAKAVGPSIPFFGAAVRLHNQLLYAGLGISPSPHVLIGKDHYLLNPFYTNTYCRRDLAASAGALRDWARTLRGIQDMVEARGQIFLYVLTPSKVEHIPEMMPAGFPCISLDRQRFIAVALSYLDAAGVKYLDATVEIDAIEQRYGYEPFSRYGIHWTHLAAYPPTQRLIQAINHAKGAPALIPYGIAVRPAEPPAADDYDYGTLLNVLRTPKPADTGAISVTTPAPAQCPARLSIVAVGGSFFTALGANLSRAPCPPDIVQLSYLILATLHFEAGKISGTDKPDYARLHKADAVILEENAGILLTTRHIQALHDYLKTGRLPTGGVY